MAGVVPVIHADPLLLKVIGQNHGAAWMAGTSPAMTEAKTKASEAALQLP
jgi:hypothetical protein